MPCVADGHASIALDSGNEAPRIRSTIRGVHILVGLTLLTFVVDLLFLTVAIDMALAIPVTLPRATLFTGLALLGISAVLAALAARPGRGQLLAPRRLDYHS